LEKLKFNPDDPRFPPRAPYQFTSPEVRNQILGSVLVFALCLPSGFSETIAKNPFTSELRLELSPCSLPCARPAGTTVASQTRSAEHLQLARIYADANRIEAAVAEYAKIMDSDDAKMRATALAETKSVLGLRHRSFTWISGRFTMAANFVLAGFGLFLLVLLIWLLAKLVRFVVRLLRYCARIRRLEIQPLTCWPPSQTPNTHFREIMRYVRDEMNRHFSLAKQVNSAQEETVLPSVFSHSILDELEVPMSIVSEKGWPFFAWFVRQINPPDLTLEGSLSSDDATFHVIVRLVRNSETQEMWDRAIPKTELSEGLKDLAYSVLIWFTSKGRQ
jgi:hypothetical protein